MKYWGGGKFQGPLKFYMSIPWQGDLGACSHRKILKTTILETLFLAFGDGILQNSEGCKVCGRHDFFMDYFSTVNEWEKVKQKEAQKLLWKFGAVFFETSCFVMQTC